MYGMYVLCINIDFNLMIFYTFKTMTLISFIKFWMSTPDVKCSGIHRFGWRNDCFECAVDEMIDRREKSIRETSEIWEWVGRRSSTIQFAVTRKKVIIFVPPSHKHTEKMPPAHITQKWIKCLFKTHSR